MNDNIHTDNTETLRNALAENERLRADLAVSRASEQAPAQEAVAWMTVIGGTKGTTPVDTRLFNYKALAEAYLVEVANFTKGYTKRLLPLYTAPPAREPSVSVAELRELVEKWRSNAASHDMDAEFRTAKAKDDCADELNAICDRAAKEKTT